MRSVSLVTGLVAKARRAVAQAASVGLQDDEVSAAEVAKTIRQVVLRMNKLEAALPPEATEFEVVVGASGAITELAHNFSGPVRWYVTEWLQASGAAYPQAAPILANDSTSTADILRLRSYQAGRAVIRVEPSQAYLDPGIIVVPTPPAVVPPTEYKLALTNNFTTTNQTATGTNLTFPVAANEAWAFFYQADAGNSAVGGMAYAIGAPTGATVAAMHYSCTTNLTTRVYQQISAINTLGTATHTVAGGQRDDQIVGVLKNGSNAGSFTIQAASITAATTTTINKKAQLIARLVTEV